jgi:hypothetical protein
VYHEITVWTRGIIMDKEARDVVNCMATAASNTGLFSHYISDYVDDPRPHQLPHPQVRAVR